MLRSSIALILLALAASCGGKARSTSNTIPDSKLDASADPVAAPGAATEAPTPAAPTAPAAPAGPIKVAFAASQATVKLLSPGKGKRAPLRMAPTAAGKQQVEWLMDAVISQAPTGQTAQTVTMPTVVLVGTGEVTAVGADGVATYRTVIDAIDARAVPGQSIAPESIKSQVVSLTGMVVDGSVAPGGATGATTYVIEKPVAETAGAIESLRLMLPTWVPLPTEPIGVGAQWEVSLPVELNGIATTHVTVYKLVSRTASTAVLSGVTKVQGANQNLQDVEVSEISGQGTVSATLETGKLYPKLKRDVSTKVRLKQGSEDVTITMQIGSGFDPK